MTSLIEAFGSGLCPSSPTQDCTSVNPSNDGSCDQWYYEWLGGDGLPTGVGTKCESDGAGCKKGEHTSAGGSCYVGCAPGSWSSNGAITAGCEPCAAGYFGSSVGNTDETCDGPCPAGEFSNVGATKCSVSSSDVCTGELGLGTACKGSGLGEPGYCDFNSAALPQGCPFDDGEKDCASKTTEGSCLDYKCQTCSTCGKEAVCKWNQGGQGTCQGGGYVITNGAFADGTKVGNKCFMNIANDCSTLGTCLLP